MSHQNSTYKGDRRWASVQRKRITVPHRRCARECICGGFDRKLEDLTLWLSNLEAHTQKKFDVEDLIAGDKKNANWKKRRLGNERRRAGCCDICKNHESGETGPERVF